VEKSGVEKKNGNNINNEGENMFSQQLVENFSKAHKGIAELDAERQKAGV